VTSAPSTTTTSKTVNNKTGVTTATSTSTSGGSSTVTKTTTIGTPATVSSSSSKSVSTPAALPGAALGSKWITGPNTDGWNLCAPVAVANALLGATGTMASNGQIERLYHRAGGTGSTGVPAVSAFAAAHLYGIAGVRLKNWRRAGLDDADILLLQFPEGLHSAAFAGMNVITWGGEIPLEDLDARIVGAWSLTWHGTEAN
jgi:hypothetical protein